MNTTLAHQGGGDIADPPLELNLFLAFEDEPTAERAKRAAHRVLSQPAVNARPELRLWKLDELAATAQRDRALQEAAAADILMVSLHDERRLMPEAAATFKQWAGFKRDKSCALVISLDPAAKPGAEMDPSLKELCAVAERNGITFMFQFEEPPLSAMEAIFADVQHRAHATSHVLEEINARTSSHRHWGLNE